jgi:lipid II:glycine glycyltransferase (peptidoglycan interpeptide bridge formation enzyme)
MINKIKKNFLNLDINHNIVVTICIAILFFSILFSFSWYLSYLDSPRHENNQLNSFLTKNQKSRLDRLGVSEIQVIQVHESKDSHFKNLIRYSLNGEVFIFQKQHYFFRYIDENDEEAFGYYFFFDDNRYVIKNSDNITYRSTSRIDDAQDINENIKRSDAIINAVEMEINRLNEMEDKARKELNKALLTDDYYSRFPSVD